LAWSSQNGRHEQSNNLLLLHCLGSYTWGDLFLLNLNLKSIPYKMNYLLGNKNIVDWGVFAEVEDSTDPELTQQIELVLPEHIQQQIYKLITDNIDQAKAIEAMAQF